MIGAFVQSEKTKDPFRNADDSGETGSILFVLPLGDRCILCDLAALLRREFSRCRLSPFPAAKFVEY